MNPDPCRAGWLLLKQLHHKIFGDSGTTDKSETDFLDRFDFDLGAVNPQTGEQSFVTRFKIADHWMLVGTTGIGGGVEGKLKYVIRLR